MSWRIFFTFFINEPLGNLAFFHRFFERPRQTVIVKIIGDGHLQIQRALRRFLRVVDGSPVGDHHSVVAPFFPQDIR